MSISNKTERKVQDLQHLYGTPDTTTDVRGQEMKYKRLQEKRISYETNKGTKNITKKLE